MERIMSPEERIRRAEQIYFNRQGNNRKSTVRIESSDNAKKSSHLLKKMVLQIGICVVIYFILFLIKNTEYVFSETVLRQVEQFLNTEINWSETFGFMQNKMQEFHKTVSSFRRRTRG